MLMDPCALTSAWGQADKRTRRSAGPEWADLALHVILLQVGGSQELRPDKGPQTRPGHRERGLPHHGRNHLVRARARTRRPESRNTTQCGEDEEGRTSDPGWQWWGMSVGW